MMQLKKRLSLPFVAFIVPWTIYFGIIWVNAVQVRPDGWYAAYLPHWGDGVAHLSYMATFAYRTAFPTTHPLFANHPFTYSFAADMLGGLIARAGIPLWLAYNIWGFALSITGLVALWLLIRVLTRSDLKTWTVLNLFLASGGIGWKYLILDRLYPEQIPDSPFFPVLLTQRENTDIAWLNTIVGELIPQRAFLLALPVAAFLLVVWYRRFILNRHTNPFLLFATGILFGLMPVIHPHTTMVLALTIVCWSLPELVSRTFEWFKQNQSVRIPAIWRDLAVIALPTVMLGGFLTLTFLAPSVSSGFFKWYPGWLARSKEVNWFGFWWNNWGLFLPLAATGTVLFAGKNLKRVLLPFWLWFALTNLFLFQPYDWDNSKILTWVYLFFAIPVTLCLAFVWRAHLFGKLITILLFITLTLSGGIDAAKMLDTGTYALMIVDNGEIELAARLRDISDPGAVILTSTTHRNWVPILTGRQILCGYLGWMWTYGITADQRVADIRNIYRGTRAADHIIGRYGIDYVVVGPEEKNEFTVNEAYFASRYPVVLENSTTTVYKID